MYSPLKKILFISAVRNIRPCLSLSPLSVYFFFLMFIHSPVCERRHREVFRSLAGNKKRDKRSSWSPWQHIFLFHFSKNNKIKPILFNSGDCRRVCREKKEGIKTKKNYETKPSRPEMDDTILFDHFQGGGRQEEDVCY